MNRLALICAFALLSAACSGPATGESDVTAPTFKDFKYVSDALGYKCGTLDCHGQPGRNLRVWSKYGMRVPLNSSPPPVTGDLESSQADVEATYRSVVGLEPEMMSQVVKDGGRDPQRLTLIRKARGTEAHKGHKIMSAGDSLDLCITSWLTGKVLIKQCQQNAPALQPPNKP